MQKQRKRLLEATEHTKCDKSNKNISLSQCFSFQFLIAATYLYLLGIIPHCCLCPSVSNFHARQCPGTPLNIVLSTYNTSSLWKQSCRLSVSSLPLLSNPQRTYRLSPGLSLISLYPKAKFLYYKRCFLFSRMGTNTSFYPMLDFQKGSEYCLQVITGKCGMISLNINNRNHKHYQ